MVTCLAPARNLGRPRTLFKTTMPGRTKELRGVASEAQWQETRWAALFTLLTMLNCSLARQFEEGKQRLRFIHDSKLPSAPLVRRGV